MKKVFFVSAIVLMAAAAFVGCKKNDPVANGTCTCYLQGAPASAAEYPNYYADCEALATVMSVGGSTFICE